MTTQTTQDNCTRTANRMVEVSEDFSVSKEVLLVTFSTVVAVPLGVFGTGLLTANSGEDIVSNVVVVG